MKLWHVVAIGGVVAVGVWYVASRQSAAAGGSTSTTPQPTDTGQTVRQISGDVASAIGSITGAINTANMTASKSTTTSSRSTISPTSPTRSSGVQYTAPTIDKATLFGQTFQAPT